MRLTSDCGDFIDLVSRSESGDADLALTVRVSRDGFTGETDTWVDRHAWFAFTQQLTILESTRVGEAHIESMSPGELELTVKAIDRLGHLGVEGLIGKREYDRELTFRFSVFAFDPSQIVTFTRDAQKLSEVLGGWG